MGEPDHAPRRPSSQVGAARESLRAPPAPCVFIVSKMPRSVTVDVARRCFSVAFALTVMLASSAAIGQDAAELLKGRRALVQSCIDAVNAPGVRAFEAVVDDDGVIHVSGSAGDTVRFEKCLSERESIAGTLLPKEKWRK